MQIKASDQWSFYQAKGIKAGIWLLLPQNATVKSPEVTAKEQDTIKKIAQEDEAMSEVHLEKHLTLARSVTLLQVAIAISAISIITRKRFLWYAGMVIAVAGVYYFTVGML